MDAQRVAGIFRTEFLRAGLEVDPKEIEVRAVGQSFMVTVTLPEHRGEGAWTVMETARRRAEQEESAPCSSRVTTSGSRERCDPLAIEAVFRRARQ
jgi:hypothetical protein